MKISRSENRFLVGSILSISCSLQNLKPIPLEELDHAARNSKVLNDLP